MKSCTRIGLALALTSGLAGLGLAQSTSRESVDSGGAQGNNASIEPALSADGRFVAFNSAASNLVPGDTNGWADVFVHDRQTGATERVSVATGGAQGNADSYFPALSADGRFVAFASDASNLVGGDTNGVRDIFVHDRQTGTTVRASVGPGGAQANDQSNAPSLSDDGHFVTFSSPATNLVAGGTNGIRHVYVRDNWSGANELASVDSSGLRGNSHSFDPTISADGRFVAFWSYASNLVPGDTNFLTDTFVHDRQTGATIRVSVSTAGLQSNADSYYSPISADGRFVAFESYASNLVAGGPGGVKQIFVHDCQTLTTERVSADSAGAAGNADSLNAAVSADGRFVSFASAASNLVAGDTNAAVDIFLRDRQISTTGRMSVDSAGTEADSSSDWSAISADGRFVAFHCEATNLVPGDTNSCTDVFVRDIGQPGLAFCFGDGGAVPCPCSNSGTAGHGCENSASTGGAVISGSGTSSLANDTLLLGSAGELPSATSIFLQGDAAISATNFGDGLRCAGGLLKRLYVKVAVSGSVTAPQAGDPPVSARSAALGDTIGQGTTRHYQVYYRDPNPGFCATPQGNTWNVSNALSVTWLP